MMILDLQRFAEKTEKPTAKRRTDAKRKGQSGRSQDLTSAISFLAIIAALRLFGGPLYRALYATMQSMLSSGVTYASGHTGVPGDVGAALTTIGMALLPVVIIGMVLGSATAYLQVGPTFTPSTLLPDFARVNIGSGIRRLFSSKAVVDLLKATVKLSMIAIAVFFGLQGFQGQILSLMETDPSAILGFFLQTAFSVVISVAVMFAALSFADLMYQRFSFQRDLRMTKDEVKEETKSQEGNPLIRRKIRERGRAIARRRMMQKVPTADVIITNPTHYAIALKYDPGTMHAPQVVAKGTDETALRIRALGIDHRVPIVENRPLARSLYQLVELDGYVPGQLFQAVAEVLAYVYRLKQRAV